MYVRFSIVLCCKIEAYPSEAPLGCSTPW